MPQLTFSIFQGYIFSLFAVSALTVLGAIFAIFSASYLGIAMVLYSLFIFSDIILNAVKINLSFFQIFPGFLLGFFIALGLTYILNKIPNFSSINIIKKHYLVIGIVIFLFVTFRKLLEGFTIADVFSDFGPGRFPIHITLLSFFQLFIREFPFGFLLIAPFIQLGKPKSGLMAFISNQLIFLIFSILCFAFILNTFTLSLFEKLFLNAIPAGGLLFLGIWELIKSRKREKFQLWVILIVIFLFSLYWTRQELFEEKEGTVTGYEINSSTGQKIPIMSGNHCEKIFELDCLND